MRHFNTEGPVAAAEHYLIPPLERVDREQILTLIRRKYFVLHAPRQTGKTTVLLALRDLLNSGSQGDCRCVYASFEAGRTAGGDVERAMRSVLGELGAQAEDTLGDGFVESGWREMLDSAGPDRALRMVLRRWCAADPRPLVLLLDEVDTLTGDALLSVLSQLRSGYPDRPARSPQSVVLCGLRDVQDYRAPGAKGSPFNIKAKSLRLGDFSEAETRALLGQHTEETGQAFAEEALAMVWRETRGQPWLVNALAHEACFESPAGRDRSRTITEEDILEARERLIEGRATHLDNLGAKLEEARVRRVIEPMLSGGRRDESTVRDIKYVRDLGLIAGGRSRAHRQPDLCGGHPPRVDLDAAGEAVTGDGVVRGFGRRTGGGQTARRVPAVLPGALGALGGTLRICGGGSAAHPAGVPPADRERGRPAGAGVTGSGGAART